MSMRPIWIADDDQSIRFVLEKAFQRQGWITRSFKSAQEVTSALRTSADEDWPLVLVSDIRMPGESGLDLLGRIKVQHPDLPVIIMTAYSDLDSAVAAFQGGAFEYLAKPFDVPKAVELVERALAQRQDAQSADSPTGAGVSDMLGQAPAMQEVFRAIGRLSQSQVTVLITGESGTGKELVAQALHKHSPRSSGPFVAINTAAIPKDLLESELFGHERGAFTGAQTMRRGRFEQADGGTLFLDEIGDMPFELQTRLLRVLSDGQFYRVGGHTPIRSNVRVIAATHQNLEQRVRDGLFREDLFHRLNVIRLRIPALRERLEDLPLLTHHFLQQAAKQLGGEPKRLSPAALDQLAGFGFPGNVRQLENVCHWLTVMAPAQVVDVTDLPPEILQGMSSTDPHVGMVNKTADMSSQAVSTQTMAKASDTPVWTAAMTSDGGRSDLADWPKMAQIEAKALLDKGDQTPVWDHMVQILERHLIRAALEKTGGRRVEAAQILGIGRNTITRKIQELGL